MLRKLIALAALAVAVAAVSGLGYAAIPGADGVISACRDSRGVLKVIDAEAGETCGPNQQQLTWNQQGPQGPAGPPGASGVSGWQYVVSPGRDIPPGSAGGWNVDCPVGKKALGGGVSQSFADAAFRVAETTPSGSYGNGTGWYARVYNEGRDGHHVRLGDLRKRLILKRRKRRRAVECEPAAASIRGGRAARPRRSSSERGGGEYRSGTRRSRA
jgi:hypothetical protein